MKAQVKLVRKVEIGDMGSIVFPASDVFISWILDVEDRHPGVWRNRNIVGGYILDTWVIVDTWHVCIYHNTTIYRAWMWDWCGWSHCCWLWS